MKQLLQPGKKSSELKLLISVLGLIFGGNLISVNFEASTFEQLKVAVLSTIQGDSLNAIVILVIGYFGKRGWLKS